MAKALRYALKRRPSFTRFLRTVAWRSTIFLPSEQSGQSQWAEKLLVRWLRCGWETLADAMTIIETAKLHDLNPEAYLTDISGRINDHKINALDELLPWKWRPVDTTPAEVAP